jgi:hypothetical protein
MDKNTNTSNDDFLSALFELEAAAARFRTFVAGVYVADRLPKRRGARPKYLRNFQKRPFSDSAYLYKLCFDNYHAGGGKIESMIFALDERTQKGKQIAVKNIYYSQTLTLDELQDAVLDTAKI